ncbi:YjzC family protein [Salipaludibacillus neizhouensis]|uniref:YjzC family protein n=1 Tax=Salipaludibacillus neizhouensis TaxID=885475 RepID=A0A3A9K8B6_9BACI|nr:YjzC family protein [Salipaludibacillus neizhouensis]RKL67748.1 YjzC family protein [Salipaludibacillus neizhouensis]
MGQQKRFKHGEKAPNNGVYIEIGETGSMVQKPKQVHLEAGDKFPESSNHNRVWSYKVKPDKSWD